MSSVESDKVKPQSLHHTSLLHTLRKDTISAPFFHKQRHIHIHKYTHTTHTVTAPHITVTYLAEGHERGALLPHVLLVHLVGHQHDACCVVEERMEKEEEG
jgi:hypothetical protein